MILGIVNHAFTPEQIVDLLYGPLKYHRSIAARTEQEVHFCEWNAYPKSMENWGFLPVEERREFLALLMKTIEDSCNSRFDCFHTRILCLLHYLLDDEENVIECIANYPWGQNTVNERKYSAFFSINQERVATLEMFLWFNAGLKRTEEEHRLLKLVWKKLFSYNNIKSQKKLKNLVEQKISSLEIDYKIATRQVKYNDTLIKRYNNEKMAIKKRHLSQTQRETLLHQIEIKDNNAHCRFRHGQERQCQNMLALNFLNGYLDFIKIINQ